MDPLTQLLVQRTLEFESAKNKFYLIGAVFGLCYYLKDTHDLSAMAYPWLFVIFFFFMGRLLMSYAFLASAEKVANKFKHPGIDDSVPFGNSDDV